MSWLTTLHTQTATLWARTGVDSAGDPSFASPTTITVKWEESSEVIINNDGREEQSHAVVYLGQDVVIGDFLFLGTSVVVDPTAVSGAFEVKTFRKIPTPDGSDFERKALL